MQRVRVERNIRVFSFEALEPRALLSATTLWDNNVSAPEWDQDFNAVELGVKFQSSAPGYILGIRFLKGANNIGVHIGHLWDGNGTPMGTVTFVGETASGWQEADFAAPIPILANHTYVASYFAPVARYAYAYNYFTGASHSSSDGLLTALASGTDGPNGVFTYTTIGAFPTSTFRDLNYWVDVAFSLTPSAADISLSNNNVAEHQPPGTSVGTLSTSGTPHAFTYTLVSGPGSADNAAFTISGNTLKTAATFDFHTKNTYSIRVRSTDENGLFAESALTIHVTNVVTNAVVNRQLFYFNSTAFDAVDHDNAIATDKVPLLPGQTAAFDNYSSYDRGINGIMIDISGPLGALSASDFAFKVGNDNLPGGWAAAPAPSSMLLCPGFGVGGSTRVEFTWDDHAIQNQWLQVTVPTSADIDLAGDDVFYFGNAVGETGDSSTDAKVTATDEIAARAHPGAALIDNQYDFNRDGVVDSSDQTIARSHVTNFLNALNLISPPAPLGSFSLLPAISTGPVIAMGPTVSPVPVSAVIPTPVTVVPPVSISRGLLLPIPTPPTPRRRALPIFKSWLTARISRPIKALQLIDWIGA